MNHKGLIKHLEKCRGDLDYKDLTWVIGNESVDLDSVVSTLIYAYHIGGVPIINCTKDEFAAKTEVRFVLRELGIGDDLLIFANNIKGIAGRIVLVDHNQLDRKFFSLGDVWQIFDHHKTSRKHPAAELVRIEKVGSCSTLIFDQIEKEISIDDEMILKMIIAPILLDTFNLDAGANKACELDQQVVKTILERTSIDQNDWFKTLSKAKRDIRGLSPKQLLGKDCKVFSDFVISSIPIPLKEYFESATSEVEDFFKSSQKKLFILMTIYQDLEFERELMIYCGDEWSIEESAMTSLQQGGLELTPITIKGGYSCYKQNNIIISRKEVVPLIQEIFKRS